MNRKCLSVVNLLGDSIYLLGPVKKYIEQHLDEVAAILVDHGIGGQLFERQFRDSGIPFVHSEEEAREIDPNIEFLYLNAGRAGELCYARERSVGKCPHISEGYALLLGVNIEGQQSPPIDWQHYTFHSQEYSLISPFSRSCSRHSGQRPNKTLDDWKWEPIIQFLRRHNYAPVKVIGAPNERLNQCSLLESDYLSTPNLQELELAMRKASMVISIDNGIAHFASALGLKTVVLWNAAANPDFIAPKWSPNTAIAYMGDPNPVQPAQLLVGVRKMVQWLEDGRR